MHGFTVEVIWGHEFQEQLKRNRHLRQLWNSIDAPGPMDPRRDALRGGRTEPFRLHYKCKEDEEILGIDIVSIFNPLLILSL